MTVYQGGSKETQYKYLIMYQAAIHQDYQDVKLIRAVRALVGLGYLKAILLDFLDMTVIKGVGLLRGMTTQEYFKENLTDKL